MSGRIVRVIEDVVAVGVSGAAVFGFWWCTLGVVGCSGVNVPYPSVRPVREWRVQCPKEDAFHPAEGATGEVLD